MLGKNLITAAAGNAGSEVLGVEDVFSTWLYTGNGSTQTITNGIDLSGEGGLVWIKGRNAAFNHYLFDTARGTGNALSSDSTNAADVSAGNGITAFAVNGFTVNNTRYGINTNSYTYASWTFRKAPKFFDVVTYTGDGIANRQVAHSLASAPGTIIVKCTNTTSDWWVWHRGNGTTPRYLRLNTTAADTGNWSVQPVAGSETTVFEIRGGTSHPNVLGNTYVAYLFAHDAGGFGDDGNESVVSCGSYTGNGSATGPTVNLGWEPQWVMIKNATSTGNWNVHDNMRGFLRDGASQWLRANLSDAEGSQDAVSISSTGFSPTFGYADWNTNGQTYIYIAIRRGLMKRPTDATTVFKANYETEARSTAGWTSLSGFPDDAFWMKSANVGFNWELGSRLTVKTLSSNTTSAEQSNQYFGWDTQDGIKQGTTSYSNNSGHSYADYHFRRAPGFFDVVAYTGTGTFGTTISHNLGVAPELIILKSRSAASTRWPVYQKFYPTTGGNLPEYGAMFLNTTDAWASGGFAWANTAPSATTFSVGFTNEANASGATYIAYLFASRPGVSKVGSYTGTGTTLNVDCGFTAGARFVLIKRTDSTGDWYVWDTARGISSGNDPYLLLNTSDVEVTSTDYIDPLSSGFQISSTAPAAINASGGSFIYLAIA